MNLHIAPDQFTMNKLSMELPENIAVVLEDATVRYRIPRERYRTFKEFAIRRVQGKVHFDELLALDKVNLQIQKGEVFGLIGANGAGKTTLLRLVARVMRPTSGRIVVYGRVAPLLAMGAGFHPELTGRENVYLNGALLGYTRHEIEELFDEIVDFAELRDFIDAPLRTYSSGMMARLGFSVATAKIPDILILDEVLSVGDIAFQEKSGKRIKQFQEHGATTLYVSHSMKSIEGMCNRVAWVDHGKIKMVGDTKEIIEQFQLFMNIEVSA
ncbi:MAG: ABC transporter ATP-binding protein [Anaerolineaceae bacterium]|nr:ABC transporter ATP-binding protein [Anaerolineaceae bacterium]